MKATMVILVVFAFIAGSFYSGILSELETVVNSEETEEDKLPYNPDDYLQLLNTHYPLNTTVKLSSEAEGLLEIKPTCSRYDWYNPSNFQPPRREIHFLLHWKNVSNRTIEIEGYWRNWTLETNDGVILFSWNKYCSVEQLSSGEEKNSVLNFGILRDVGNVPSMKFLVPETEMLHYNDVALLHVTLQMSFDFKK